MVEDPQFLANHGLVEIGGGVSGTTQRSVNGPVSFSDIERGPIAPVPSLGEHTDEVIRELADRSNDRQPSQPAR